MVCLDTAIATAAGAELEVRIEPVALTGQIAPGTNGARFDRLSLNPTISDRGEIAFLAWLQGPEVSSTNDAAAFGPDGAGGLALIAREGAPAPGTDARFGDPFQEPRLNDVGQVALIARLEGPVPATTDVGIFGPGSTPGSLALVARTGQLAPGASPGARFSGTGNVSINNRGQVAFRAHLFGATPVDANVGIWRTDEAGALRAVAVAGDPAPGTEEGVVFGRFSLPIIEDSGLFGFSSIPSGPGIGIENSESIWIFRPGTGVELVARAGAPNPEDGAPFGLLSQPVFDEAGGVAFRDSPYPSAERRIWATRDGRLTRVSRWGDPVPGAGEGVFYADQGFPYRNDAGRIAFNVGLQGPAVSVGTHAGVVASDETGEVRLLFRAGDPVPGLPAGAVFSDVFGSPALTGRGDLVVVANLPGPGDTALVFVDRSGETLSFARRFGELEVAPGDVRPTIAIGFYRPVDELRGINDRRELALGVRFADGSAGVFRARIGNRARIALLERNPKSQDRSLRLAILGEEQLPVETIDPTSVELCVIDGDGSKLGCVHADASHRAPGLGIHDGADSFRPDGFDDLVLAFDRSDLEALQAKGSGDLHAVIEGSFQDGSFFWSREGIPLGGGEDVAASRSDP